MIKRSSVLVFLSGVTLLGASSLEAQNPVDATANIVSDGETNSFVPRPDAAKNDVSLEYSFLDKALAYMVLRMGPSTRQGLGRPDPLVGTHHVYGHKSRFRLEGNRIIFSLLDPEDFAPLAEYRRDLERVGSEVDITSLPRNEQLAYWINLHNVAVIEQIAAHYPVASPSRIRVGPNKRPLDEARFIEVAGVKLSPKDIRTAIVYPNWDDPVVMYGFFRGEIGGPSIQRTAYTGANVRALLNESANEFVNSLRGVEGNGGTLLVSKIYDEAAAFYFPRTEQDLHAHLAEFAEDDVAAILARTSAIETNIYDDAIADLAGGEREPEYNYVDDNNRFRGVRLTASMRRMLSERANKYEKLRDQGRIGRVIILPGTSSAEEEIASEVD
ncbi:DUF547 domain-containing protein [Erythrobacter litoralis]|uniref:DUF547 domain-containing protein n=1 Tax=Erythrobacter litoralis TaxID=39960 RepID=UPI00243495D8|nr:DUF547 domain-containing protein [Erythrobacter litoralis]MDG6078872.1 DUF547 domain-containing protein [Erythrobacter litoralis]